MATLYVTEQGAHLRLEQGRLLVQIDGATRTAVRLNELARVMLFGGIGVSSGALTACLDEGIDLVFLTLNGELRGRLVGTDSGDIERRLAHYEAWRDESRRLTIARAMVDAKLRNSLRLVSRCQAKPICALDAACQELRQARRRAKAADDLDALRGHEGHAARIYFGARRHMVRGELVFPGRARRPPPDPVNALLSLGYSLVGAELIGALTAVGLDPHLGFLHAPDFGRPSLAQDLLEEFRAGAVDRLVLKLVNRRTLRPEHFEEREEGGVGLTKPGWRRCSEPVLSLSKGRVRTAP